MPHREKHEDTAESSNQGSNSQKKQKSAVDRRLEKYARQIIRRGSRQDGGDLNSPENSASGYTRKTIYKKVLAWRAQDRLHTVKQDLTALGHAPKGDLAQNDFAWLASAIFGKLGQSGKSVDNRIRTIARDLAHADRNGVPVEYLIGFIHQVGGSKRIEQLWAEERRSANGKARVDPCGDDPTPKTHYASKRESRRLRLKQLRLKSGRAIKTKRRTKPAR